MTARASESQPAQYLYMVVKIVLLLAVIAVLYMSEVREYFSKRSPSFKNRFFFIVGFLRESLPNSPVEGTFRHHRRRHQRMVVSVEIGQVQVSQFVYDRSSVVKIKFAQPVKCNFFFARKNVRAFIIFLRKRFSSRPQFQEHRNRESGASS